LADAIEGLRLEDTPSPKPDRAAASANPHADALRSVTVGDVFGGERVFVSLAMMAARDTDDPDNPIHSSPQQAKDAGLDRPIAGGSHVLGFAIEAVMAALGEQVVLHGASFDIRWKAPTECDVDIVPTARVISASGDQVVLDLQVDLAAGQTAMVGRLTIPLA
jgi:acyl dehydratase